MNKDIDVDRLRKDLINYYGTAMFNSNPIALMDISKVEKASEQEVVNMAKSSGINLNWYRK